ncbi:adult-specific cuticular protein ACP-20-like [Ctenocephalides felis]|uniref:adult-specific cuticular protein ACP-20-like n=1 Tax=Ctenocephalides felis TaxID=7515 RepID=UPI000E6E37DC|nr:adult-specific cuticular protein ACP-20-like [Ctenocephalides felis]
MDIKDTSMVALVCVALGGASAGYISGGGGGFGSFEGGEGGSGGGGGHGHAYSFQNLHQTAKSGESGGNGGGEGGHHYYHDHFPEYKYDYAVKDHHTGDHKKAWETRHGDVVKGGYMLKEADGTTRVVEYTADKHNGFNAIVKRIGHAEHPQIYKKYDEGSF